LFGSLFLKISISVGVVITLTVGFFAYFLMENQKEHLLYAKSKEIEILSTMIRNGITSFMKEGGSPDIHNFLKVFGVQEGLMELRILDRDGTVLRSSRKIEEGTSMADLISGQIPSGKTMWVSEQEIRSRPFFSSIQTLENEPGCFSCHSQDKKILGILHVALPMEMTQKSIVFNRNLLIASTLITLLLMAAAVNLLLTRLVKKPVGLLIETMSQVEKGDLNVEVNLGTQDELGRLAKSFSSMVQKLHDARRELERQQQQQMRQVKHLASLGELAASVAHEIKNPLAGIKLAIQVLAKEPNLASSHRGTIEEIMHSIERLDKTMVDLLSYSRIRPPELKSVSLHEVIEAALNTIKEECQIAGVRVGKYFDVTLPPCPLDSQQMERAFLNLFLNALQVMPQGGVLTIQTKYYKSGYHLQEGYPKPGSSGPDEGWAEVTVTDTGEGMPPEVLGEIFRPFFTTKAKGTGLGLSLAQRIVEQHHGQIFAQSRVGVGTTFHLLLPIPLLAAKGEPG
jgi:signal transduction histidine kinase